MNPHGGSPTDALASSGDTSDALHVLLARLALAHAILASNGHDDLTLGHMALRDPQGRGFWMKRSGTAMDEISPDRDFLLIAFDGQVVEGNGRRHAEWPIHAELMRARADVLVSAHTHPEYATLLSAFGASIRPLTTDGGYLGEVRCVHIAGSHIDTPARGMEVARALGDRRAVLLRNHGAVFCGRSIEQATLIGVYLERAARAELRVRSVSGIPIPASPEDVAGRAEMIESDRWLVDSFDCLARRAGAASCLPGVQGRR